MPSSRFLVTLLVFLLLVGSALVVLVSVGGGDQPKRPEELAQDSDLIIQTAVPLEDLIALSDPRARETAVASDQSVVELVQQFVDSESDPCTLPVTDSPGHPAFQDQYSSLSDLINDADVVLVGRVTGTTLEDVRRGTMASAILAEFEIEEVVAGTVAGSSIDIDLGERVTAFGYEFRRTRNQLDSCSSARVLLFADRNYGSGFGARAGWVNLDSPDLEASPLVGVFAGYTDARALLADVRESAATLQAQGLPKGLLACQGRYSSEYFIDPIGCPGDRLDISQTFELASVVEAHISTPDPGPSRLAVQYATLKADSVHLSALLSALDFSAVLEPLGPEPPDVIRVSLNVKVGREPGRTHAFAYSPTGQVIRLSPYGQFPAPPALVQALTPFLVP